MEINKWYNKKINNVLLSNHLIKDYFNKIWNDVVLIQAIIPNFIHSLDASHLINLINNAIKDNFTPIISVHDCFGTLPNKMGELEHRVKKIIYNIIYSRFLLTNFPQ